MNTYIDGTAIKIEINLVNGLGEAVVASAVEYSITDSKGVQKLPRQALSDFVEGSIATIAIDPAVNTMTAVGDLNDYNNVVKAREARVINLFVTVDGEEYHQEEIYVLERANVLIEGVNSLQTYPDAVSNALNFVGMDGWNNATKAQRIAAMLKAGDRIRALSFDFSNTDMRRVSYKLKPTAILADIGQAEFLALDDRFKQAVAYAQLIEANNILDEDEDAAMLAAGVTGIRIGETQKTYKATQSVTEPLCKAAMEYIRPYYTISAKLGRA
jgi:hypothetical protein